VSIRFAAKARDHDPGLQPWVKSLMNSSRRLASEVSFSIRGQTSAGGTIRTTSFAPTGRVLWWTHNPGLKAWTIIYNRFAVNPTDTGDELARPRKFVQKVPSAERTLDPAFRPPAIFWLVSEDFSRFLNRQQGFVLPERTLMRNSRENLFQQ
jgi:hypothetical protein